MIESTVIEGAVIESAGIESAGIESVGIESAGIEVLLCIGRRTLTHAGTWMFNPKPADT